MRKIINIVLVSLIVIFINSVNAHSKERKIVYFYSPTCSACVETEKLIEKELKLNIKIERHDITEQNDLKLFKSYCSTYLVPFKQQTVPAIFVGDKYLIGKSEIEKSIQDNNIEKYADKDLKNIENKTMSTKINSPLGVSYVFFSGLLDGFNPCAMAMLLLFISLLGFSSKRSTLISISITYIVALFITYFALGTLLFSFLHLLHIEKVATVVNFLVIALCLILFTFNIHDYIVSKKENYEKIRLQLPKSIQKFNKQIIRVVTKKIKENSTIVYPIVFFLGIVIALTEFLCTGQIYLPVIISLIQFSDTFNLISIIYLLIYNIAFVIPLIAVAVIAIKTQSVMSTSDKIRSKLHMIKLFNGIFFLIIALIFIFIKFYGR